MEFNQLIAGVSVGDLNRSIAWYSKLFGRSADSRPMKEVAEWLVVPSGVVQLLFDHRRAGTSHLTLEVPDLEPIRAELSSLGARHGVDGGPFRTVTVDDPDGNEITFVQVLDEDTRSSA